jgi:hypothetical protein
VARAKYLIRCQPVIDSPVKVPYSLTPSGLPDGAFPAGWTGSSWTISSGKGVCSPTLGAELLPDPGLEATYTDGLCASLTKSHAGVTVEQSADAHGGSKAQGFLSDAANHYLYKYIVPTANTWYSYSGWAKRTAGTGSTVVLSAYQASSGPKTSVTSIPYTAADWTQYYVAKRTYGTGDYLIFYAAIEKGSNLDTVLVDDLSMKAITQSTMLALRKAKTSATVKAKYTWSGNGICGVVARANAASNPNTFLLAHYHRFEMYAYCSLEKCVNGTWTTLISTYTNSPGSGGGGIPTNTQWLKIRCSGNTIQLFQNNIQVGTDQTVTDVPGVYAGVFSSGGPQLEGFFVG